MRTRLRDEEFHRFFVAEAERLRRLGLFLTGDPEAASDLAQETLVRTYRHWGRIRGEDPGPYARRTLVNLVRSAHRRSLIHRRDATAEAAAPDESGRVAEWMRLTSALRELPSGRRAAIVLRFYEDMSEADIARVLDRPLGTVKSDIHRGLAKLRELLDEPAKELT